MHTFCRPKLRTARAQSIVIVWGNPPPPSGDNGEAPSWSYNNREASSRSYNDRDTSTRSSNDRGGASPRVLDNEEAFP